MRFSVHDVGLTGANCRLWNRAGNSTFKPARE